MKNQFSLLLVLVYPPSFFLSVTKSPIGFRFILFIPLLFLLLAAQTTFFGFVWSWYVGLVSMRKHDFFLLQSDYKGKDLPLSGIIPSVCPVLLPFACAATVLFPANAIFLSDKILPSFSLLVLFILFIQLYGQKEQNRPHPCKNYHYLHFVPISFLSAMLLFIPMPVFSSGFLSAP